MCYTLGKIYLNLVSFEQRHHGVQSQKHKRSFLQSESIRQFHDVREGATPEWEQDHCTPRLAVCVKNGVRTSVQQGELFLVRGQPSGRPWILEQSSYVEQRLEEDAILLCPSKVRDPP